MKIIQKNIYMDERKTRHNAQYKTLWSKWLIEHSTSHQSRKAGWCTDSFVLRNPLLRQAPKR